jgi:hypothetical protein
MAILLKNYKRHYSRDHSPRKQIQKYAQQLEQVKLPENMLDRLLEVYGCAIRAEASASSNFSEAEAWLFIREAIVEYSNIKSRFHDFKTGAWML